METNDDLRKELAHVYELLRETDQERISYAQRLNQALLELGPARFNSNHYLTLRSEERIIELDFPVRPRCRDWSSSPHVQRLATQLKLRHQDWQKILIQVDDLTKQLLKIPLHEGASTTEPYWTNGWLPGLDAVLLYHFVKTLHPKVYFEVGSGNSTKFVRKAIVDHGLNTRIVSVDPFPRAEIDLICDQIYRVGLEDFDLNMLHELTADDIVFIDNSHRAFPNSDVTVFFTEILGRLPQGILYGLHDVFLPYDYPEGWGPRYYNEQYLLAAYLFGGADGDTIIFPAGHVSHEPDLVKILDGLWTSPFHEGILPYGGSFWLTKG